MNSTFSQRRCGTVVTILTLVVVLLGCSKAQEALSEQEHAHSVRSALGAYADAVSALAADQEVWVTQYKQATKRKDFDELRTDLLDSVLPALKQSIDVLKKVPTQTESLQSIHGSLITAYGRLADDLQAFGMGLNADNYNDHRKTLSTRLTHFHREQRRYREQIQAYYESVGVRLVASP